MEVKQIRSLAGTLIYLGIALYPMALLISSIMQQTIPFANVGLIKQLNGSVRDIKKCTKEVTYLNPPNQFQLARIVAFPDAGYPHINCNELTVVVQEGCIIGISFGEMKGDIFHTLGFVSRKQRRVADSSFAAEIIAAVSAYALSTRVQEILKYLTELHLPISLVVDNGGLQRCIATDRTPRDHSTLHSINKLRMAYEERFLEKVTWIPGTSNPADAVTKPLSGVTASLLDELLSTGKLPVQIENELGRGRNLRDEQ